MQKCFNTLRLRQNGSHLPDNTLKFIYLNENVWISLNISLKFDPKVRINNIPALVQIMVGRHPGAKPLSEPMMASLLMHICVTRHRWVKCWGSTAEQLSRLSYHNFLCMIRTLVLVCNCDQLLKQSYSSTYGSILWNCSQVNANVDHDLCCHMTSLSHNHLMHWNCLFGSKPLILHNDSKYPMSLLMSIIKWNHFDWWETNDNIIT